MNQHVLSSTALTYKHDPYTLLYPWLGSGLLTGNGRHWAVRRKLITPSFHFRILKDFLHIINTTSNRFMKLLEQESDASKGQVMDMQRLVSRLTIDVICGKLCKLCFHFAYAKCNLLQRPQWAPE